MTRAERSPVTVAAVEASLHDLRVNQLVPAAVVTRGQHARAIENLAVSTFAARLCAILDNIPIDQPAERVRWQRWAYDQAVAELNRIADWRLGYRIT